MRDIRFPNIVPPGVHNWEYSSGLSIQFKVDLDIYKCSRCGLIICCNIETIIVRAYWIMYIGNYEWSDNIILSCDEYKMNEALE